jgi:hypothetical protein
MSSLSRDGFPAHTSITREFCAADEPAPAPVVQRRSRLSRDDFSSGSTITREIFDNAIAADPHYGEVARNRDAEAAALVRAARDSILYPPRLASREVNR